MSIMRYRSTRLCQSLKYRDVSKTLVIAILCHSCVYLFCRLAGHPDPYAGCPCFARRHVALFPLFGFSINTLSMLGCFLGYAVFRGSDDAIVVVEGVQRISRRDWSEDAQ